MQNIVLRPFIKPTQDAAIMNPVNKDKNKRKTIPINAEISSPDSKVYPTFYVNELVEQFGDQDAKSSGEDGDVNVAGTVLPI